MTGPPVTPGLFRLNRPSIIDHLRHATRSDAVLRDVYDTFVGPRIEPARLARWGPYKHVTGQLQYQNYEFPGSPTDQVTKIPIADLYTAIGYILSGLYRPSGHKEAVLLLLLYAYFCGAIIPADENVPTKVQMHWFIPHGQVATLLLSPFEDMPEKCLMGQTSLPPASSTASSAMQLINPAVDWYLYKEPVRVMREGAMREILARLPPSASEKLQLIRNQRYRYCPETMALLSVIERYIASQSAAPFMSLALDPFIVFKMVQDKDFHKDLRDFIARDAKSPFESSFWQKLKMAMESTELCTNCQQAVLSALPPASLHDLSRKDRKERSWKDLQ